MSFEGDKIVFSDMMELSRILTKVAYMDYEANRFSLPVRKEKPDGWSDKLWEKYQKEQSGSGSAVVESKLRERALSLRNAVNAYLDREALQDDGADVVAKMEQVQKEQEALLEQRRMELDARESDLKQREYAVSEERKKELDARESSLKAQEDDLQSERDKLQADMKNWKEQSDTALQMISDITNVYMSVQDGDSVRREFMSDKMVPNINGDMESLEDQYQAWKKEKDAQLQKKKDEAFKEQKRVCNELYTSLGKERERDTVAD